MTGRTLLGAKTIKGQQIEDHYFGSIPSEVKELMNEIESTLLKLREPCKTRHNGVAPNKFEMSPIFEEVGIASAHNLLIME